MQNPFPDMQQYGDRSAFNDTLLKGGINTSKSVLLFLPKQDSGTATAGVLVPNLTSAAQVNTLFGPIAAQAFALFRAISPLNQVDGIGVTDGGTTAAAGSITFSGAAVATGEVVTHLAGYDVSFSVTKSDSAATQAGAAKAAINADPMAPVTAADGTTGQIVLTYDFKGTLGNSARISVTDDTAVLGSVPTIVQIGTGVAGATDPDGTTAQAALIEGSKYRIIVPLTADATTLANAVLFGGTGSSGMANATNMQGAMWIFGLKGSYSAMVAAAVAQNKPYILYGWLPEITRFHETAYCAALIEAAYQASQDDPSVPFHQQERVGLTTYPGGTDETQVDIEYVVRAGASPYTHNAAGVPIVHTCVTTCTTLSDGTPSFELASPHKWYTAIFARLFIVAARDAVTDTPDKKKMVDGFTGKLKGATVNALNTLASAPYNWLSASALAAQIKTILQAGASLGNLMRVVINTPLPTIEDYRGTDETIYLTRPTE